MNKDVSVRFSLLDQPLVDSEGLPVGRIDDLELTSPDDGTPAVAALLTRARVASRIPRDLDRDRGAASRDSRTRGATPRAGHRPVAVSVAGPRRDPASRLRPGQPDRRLGPPDDPDQVRIVTLTEARLAAWAELALIVGLLATLIARRR